jgi:hypothetical protein
VKHVAIISKSGIEDVDSDVAKKWRGITETYSLSERNGTTQLVIDINTHVDYETMFKDTWPIALEKLRKICEG